MTEDSICVKIKCWLSWINHNIDPLLSIKTMFNLIKPRSSSYLSSSSSVSSIPSFVEAYTYLAVCLSLYSHVCMRRKDSGGWVRILVVLVVAVVKGRVRGSRGGKAWVNKRRWGRIKKPGRQSFLAEWWQSVQAYVFFCNFRWFWLRRSSAKANNSLRTADVIIFWQTSQSAVTLLVCKHIWPSLCSYSALLPVSEQKSMTAGAVYILLWE